MSFMLHGTSDPLIELELRAVITIRIPSLCFASIPHGIIIRRSEGSPHPWIVRGFNAFNYHNLIVDQGPIEDGEVSTRVFNLSNRTVVIKRDVSISRLLALQLEAHPWHTSESADSGPS